MEDRHPILTARFQREGKFLGEDALKKHRFLDENGGMRLYWKGNRLFLVEEVYTEIVNAENKKKRVWTGTRIRELEIEHLIIVRYASFSDKGQIIVLAIVQPGLRLTVQQVAEMSSYPVGMNPAEYPVRRDGRVFQDRPALPPEFVIDDRFASVAVRLGFDIDGAACLVEVKQTASVGG